MTSEPMPGTSWHCSCSRLYAELRWRSRHPVPTKLASRIQMLDQSDLLRLVNQPLTESTMGEIRMAMTELAAADIGNLLSSTPAAERQQLWDLFDDDLQAEVISHIEPELVPDLFASRSAEEIAQ